MYIIIITVINFLIVHKYCRLFCYSILKIYSKLQDIVGTLNVTITIQFIFDTIPYILILSVYY